MNRKNIVRCFSIALLGVACLGAALAVSTLINTPVKAEDESAATLSIKGTCEFMNRQGTWSAELTPTETPGVYDAQYVASFPMGTDHMTYEGQVTSDFKTKISGNGVSTGGGGNGTFKFSGEYGDDGIAQCNYEEVGGMRQRSGTLTAEMPQ